MKNVLTVSEQVGGENLGSQTWPEDAEVFLNTWWVDQDDDLGRVEKVDGFIVLRYLDSNLSHVSMDYLRGEWEAGLAFPVMVDVRYTKLVSW